MVSPTRADVSAARTDALTDLPDAAIMRRCDH